MGADLSIHIYEGITEKDLENFFCHTLGSKYFSMYRKQTDDWYESISKTPSVWIGSVSWLKAALFDDDDTFIPDPVQKITDLVGEELPELTDALIAEILDALNIENDTTYDVATRDDVEPFLRENKGKKVFTVSW